MELTVNSNRKNTLQKHIAKSKKSVRVVTAISQLLFIVGLVVGALYLAVNFVSPSLSMVEVNGVIKKDINYILITSSFIFAPCFITSACLKALAKNLAGASSSARVDESLIVVDTQLTYSFRVKHQSTSSERYVITINFLNIKAVQYESNIEAFVFTGDFTSDYYEDYKNAKSTETYGIKEFIIYDYFYIFISYR